MNAQQQEAIIGYLEFHLLAFVEEAERSISDGDVIGELYARAYQILDDFENTLETQALLDNIRPLTTKRRN